MDENNNVSNGEKKRVAFEVGKFYEFCLFGSTHKYIPAMCVKVMKRKVEFQFKRKHDDGSITRVTDDRMLDTRTMNGIDEAYCLDPWYRCPTYADKVIAKPEKWDEYPEEMSEREKTKRMRAERRKVEKRNKCLLNCLAAHGVTKEMVERRIKRSVEAMSHEQYGALWNMCKSLEDGMTKVSDWFGVSDDAKDGKGNDKSKKGAK